MQGKIYSNSASIYEDEARILFDYFSSAADEIIKAEDECQARIESAKTNLSAARKKKKGVSIRGIILTLLCAGLTGAYYYLTGALDYVLAGGAVLTLLMFLVWIVTSHKAKRSVETSLNGLNDEEQKFRNIRRDYKVSKLGVAYVPIAKKVPFGNQNVTVDLSGSVNEETFELVRMNDPAAFEKDADDFKAIFSDVPVVEESKSENLDTSDYSISMQEVPMYDYVGRIEKGASRLKEDLRNVEKTSVSLPVIAPDSQNMDFLRSCGATNIEDLPVVNVFDTGSIDSRLDVFYNIYKSRSENKNTGDELALENLIRFIGVSTQTITTSKLNCCNAILEYNNGLFANVLKSPYNNYSTKLEAETIEEIKAMNFNFADMTDTYRPFKFRDSSLMKFDLYSNCWIDETGGRSVIPFSMHQIQVDIFMPIINSLMEENRIERRKIYEKIQEQKLGYLNKWHTETQDFYGRNRDSADSLKSSLIEALSSYNAAYANWKAIKDTIDKMDAQQSLLAGESASSAQDMAASMIISAQQVNENFKQLEESFESYMERLQEDIDHKANVFGNVTFFEAYLYAAEAQKAALANSNLSKLDARELKIAKVSPYLAEYGNIPPRPSIEDSVHAAMNMNLASQADELIHQIHSSVLPSEVNESAEECEDSGSSESLKTPDGELSDVSDGFEKDDESAPKAENGTIDSQDDAQAGTEPEAQAENSDCDEDETTASEADDSERR